MPPGEAAAIGNLFIDAVPRPIHRAVNPDPIRRRRRSDRRGITSVTITLVAVALVAPLLTAMQYSTTAPGNGLGIGGTDAIRQHRLVLVTVRLARTRCSCHGGEDPVASGVGASVPAPSASTVIGDPVGTAPRLWWPESRLRARLFSPSWAVADKRTLATSPYDPRQGRYRLTHENTHYGLFSAIWRSKVGRSIRCHQRSFTSSSHV